MKIKLRRNYKLFLPIILCVANIFSLFLTQMKAVVGNENISAVLEVKGYNLIEFSLLGVVVAVMPLCLLALYYSNITNFVKRIGSIFLFVLNFISYITAFITAKNWLIIDTRLFSYHMGIFIYVFITLLMFLTINILNKDGG